MPEEVEGILELFDDRRVVELGMRSYHVGRIRGHAAVVVFSRWGKVAAAATAATLILEFGVRELLFTGVAGAIDPRLRIGDVVIAERLVQHDMDARPLMPQFEIPLLQKTYFEKSEPHFCRACAAVGKMLDPGSDFLRQHRQELAALSIERPVWYSGLIGSGDRFIADVRAQEALRTALPGLMCVEMEGTAVAQVGYEYGIPATIIRTVSDTANEHSPVDFQQFISKVSRQYSREIVRAWAG